MSTLRSGVGRPKAKKAKGTAKRLRERRTRAIERTSTEPERYTPERKAEFLLSNAVDAEDYASAVAEVRRMGLDPSRIRHYRPPGA